MKSRIQTQSKTVSYFIKLEMEKLNIVHEDHDQSNSSKIIPVLENSSENGKTRNDNQDVVDQFTSSSLELLITHCKGMKMKQLGSKNIDGQTIPRSSHRYSTEQIMRIAAERFMESFTKTVDVVSMLDNPFASSFLDLPEEHAKKVELAELLMASAENVGYQIYDRARILLNRCDELSSTTGNAVERVVYYFSKALRERIDRKTGNSTIRVFNIDEAIMTPNPNLLSLCKEVPFPQMAHCTATQAIIENISKAKKIHVIDLGIRIGVQWTCLMQALVSESICPLKLLKITAVGTTMKQLIENTGKRLSSFAESIGLPFSYNVVMVSDMSQLRKELFNLEANETVVVYSSYLLKTLIPFPDTIDHVMKVMRILDPNIMVVVEPEINTTSPSFANRFVEIIFYFSAYFDCLEHCLKNDPNRENIERLLFGESIRNILAADGDDREFRHVKLDVWRAYFARFGMVETRVSELSLFHGEQMANKFASGNACTLQMNGKSLLLGWKGTPLISFSTWKFKKLI